MSNKFRQDNTDGYTDEQLAELNRRYEAGIAERFDGDDPDIQDWWAERVQRKFDNGE